MYASNSKHGSFPFKNTYSKGRAVMQMYKAVHQTKTGNSPVCE